ncbi:MAG: hypothetical protein CVV13_06900 [Gammaproteobacteria bacterium HGW-Gammaproteobacteria-3]|nr:MAG: hypothetical protein CVV13_06900 [Gammaproteobacteria bacterium HGW-Gammaproteobacteria-3]
MRSLKAALKLAMLALALTGCATTSDNKAGGFESDKVGLMLFDFNPGAPLFGVAVPEKAVSAQVADNLSASGYAITTSDSENYSHIVTVKMGSIGHGPTPTGFSFSAGNSDPRAIDYQKTDVLPMTCVLTSKDQLQQHAELTLSFGAEDYLRALRQTAPSEQWLSQWADDMSTVCFNLLSQLHLATPRKLEVEKNSTPHWAPAIEVEIENSAPQAKPGVHATEEQAVEDKKVLSEPRKRIIIHNQGSPVIFTFGHERK